MSSVSNVNNTRKAVVQRHAGTGTILLEIRTQSADGSAGEFVSRIAFSDAGARELAVSLLNEAY